MIIRTTLLLKGKDLRVPKQNVFYEEISLNKQIPKKAKMQWNHKAISYISSKTNHVLYLQMKMHTEPTLQNNRTELPLGQTREVVKKLEWSI